ncbi:MAG: hypothetical protein QXE15_02435, partial [Candidatus Bathyarchaeia archaeon]
IINIEDLSFYGGNRDYSWQGLIIGPINDILYKIIDGIYYSINKTLKAEKILFNPKQCTYVYSYEEDKVFSVKISLINYNTYVLLKVLANEPCWFTILLDFRPAEKWSEGKYLINFLDNEVIVKNSVTPVKLIISGFNKVYPLNLFLNWRYKLGDGFRQVRNGINFIEHYRSIYLPAVFYSSTGMLEMKIPLPSFLNFTEFTKIKNETLNFNFGNNIISKAIKLRLETLFSYGLNINGIWFPEAGAWWFRKPWVRDALEGLRWNIKTYIYFFNWSNKINSLIQYLLSILKSSSGLPVTIGSTEFSSDAPPQLLNVACNLAYLLKNKDLFLKIIKIAVFIVETLFKGLSISKTFLNDSILCSSSKSSWIDSIITIDGRCWPSRLPLEWIKKDVNPFESEFGLVEVNAFYIEAFKKILNFCEKFNTSKPECIKEFLKILLDGFNKYFKQNASLPALTVSPTYNLKDNTLSSPGLIASSILVGTVYNEKDLEQLWSLVSKKLLIYRKLVVLGKEWQPFGILVKAINLKPYLNDFEYHTTVVWPRDTPYLIKLLEKLNLNVKGLLLSNLDHMLTEGIFGYCSELFSLPIGKNPSPTFESNNPIPVKNPAQYWSHWCDPYIDHLTNLL